MILLSGALALSQSLVLQPILGYYLTLVSAVDTSAGGNANMSAVLVEGSGTASNLIGNQLPIYINCLQNTSTTSARTPSALPASREAT